jgi:Protein of unknown function (DUF3455)
VAVLRQSKGARIKRKCRLSRFIVACAGVLALCGLFAGAASARPAPQTAPGDPLDPRTHAPDSRLCLVVHAIGVQKYTCQAVGTWLFTDPEATLYKTTGVLKPIGTHFLNFASGRPVWQLKDGSSVEAARTQPVPAGTGNIAWLLLRGSRRPPPPTATAWPARPGFSGSTPSAGSLRPERARPAV